MRLNLSLTTKGLILVAIPTVFQMAFLVFLAVLQRKNADLREGSFHSKETRKQVHTILQNLTDAETGIRGYGLTDKAAFTEPFDRAVVDIPEELQTLQRLAQGDARQQAFAQRISCWQPRTIRVKSNTVISWDAASTLPSPWSTRRSSKQYNG
jgi:CHASE3 domain sensor protein